MSLTPEKIAELRQLLEAATPENWHWRENYAGGAIIAAGPVEIAEVLSRGGGDPGRAVKGGQLECRANAALVVAAVNALPELLDIADDYRRLAEAEKA